MISQRIQDAFNKQINAETYSAYMYWSMAAHFESVNLPGFANWMKVQAREEMVHAMKFYIHLNERGGRVQLVAIEGPPTEWDSPLAVYEATYEHETKVTALINGLMDLAIEEKDHAAHTFLNWFVDEQVEEESSADAIRQQLKLIGSEAHALLMLDRELGQRVFVNELATNAEGGT